MLGINFGKIKDNIKSTIKNCDSDSTTKEVVNILSTFLMSDDFIPFYFLTDKNFLLFICLICENQEDNLLFIKILLPLFEELKILKFETKLWQADNSESNKNNILKSYYEKNEASISESDRSTKIIEASNKVKSLKIFVDFFINVVNFVFRKDQNKNNNDFICAVFAYMFQLKMKVKKDDILQELLNYLMKLEDNLKYTKEMLYFIIFALNSCITYEKTDELDKNKEDKNKNF